MILLIITFANLLIFQEKSKEIDLQNMYSCTRKSSTSVGTLPSKSEKPHPRTFASHRNSDSPLLSSRQKAKLYAVNRQAQLRRIREVGDAEHIYRVNIILW